MSGFWDARVALWQPLLTLYHVLGCRVYEDLSAHCGAFGWGVPW